MDYLIEVVENEACVSHRVVAQFTEKQEVAISNIINKYKRDIEAFGLLHFKNEGVPEETLKLNPDSKRKKTYYLNEAQSTFLMTLLRNKPVVIEFKKRLVQEFYKLKEENAHVSDTNVPDMPQMMGVVLRLVENQQRQTDAILGLVDEIRSGRQTGSVQMPDLGHHNPHITPTQRQNLQVCIDDKVKELCSDMNMRSSAIAPALWIALKHHFDVGHYTELLADEFMDAVTWVNQYSPVKKPRLNIPTI